MLQFKNLRNGMNICLFGWGDVGASAGTQSTTSDLVIIDGKKRVRLLAFQILLFHMAFLEVFY